MKQHEKSIQRKLERCELVFNLCKNGNTRPNLAVILGVTETSMNNYIRYLREADFITCNKKVGREAQVIFSKGDFDVSKITSKRYEIKSDKKIEKLDDVRLAKYQLPNGVIYGAHKFTKHTERKTYRAVAYVGSSLGMI